MMVFNMFVDFLSLHWQINKVNSKVRVCILMKVMNHLNKFVL